MKLPLSGCLGRFSLPLFSQLGVPISATPVPHSTASRMFGTRVYTAGASNRRRCHVPFGRSAKSNKLESMHALRLADSRYQERRRDGFAGDIAVCRNKSAGPETATA